MENVAYLEENDISQSGLKSHVCQGKPVLLLIQGNFCGYCTKAKPAFEQLAKSTNGIVCATIVIDGSPSEKKAATLVGKWQTSPGVPAYLGFNSQGQFVKAHQGGRDVASLKNFASSL